MYNTTIFDANSVIARLRPFCESIHVRTEIVVIGASSILLNYNIGRVTEDVDIISKIRISSYQKYGIDIVNEGILFLCHDYRQRLIYHGRCGLVDVYALSGLDVALVKLGRGNESDLQDIKVLITSGYLSIADFCSKYPEFRQGYGGNYAIIDENFKFITGIQWKSNDRLF